MGIQPSLFMLATECFLPILQRHGSHICDSCKSLHRNKTLSKRSCWLRFTDQASSCCECCSAGTNSPLQLSSYSVHNTIVSNELTLSKTMYLWAKLHWEDDFSWTRASVVDDDFWRLWSLLTLRTIHLTADQDRRGMCGFLHIAELEAFIDCINLIHIPADDSDREELDMFGSEEEFNNLQYIRSYSERCIDSGFGMAWVHDFL